MSATFEDVTVAAGVDYLHWDPAPGSPGVDGEMFWLTGGAAAGDYDNDGWPDLYVTRLGASNLLFRNKGDGTFEELGAAAGVDLGGYSSGVAWADVNNDGFLDLLVLRLENPIRMFMNNGNGTFTEASPFGGNGTCSPDFGGGRTSAAFGDYDRDGDLDLHVVEWGCDGTLNRLFENDGTGVFQDVTETAGMGMPGVWGLSSAFADIDDDGWPDLLVSGDFGTSRLFLNLGNGQFTNITSQAGVGTDENGMGSAIADFDNDGDLDWFVTSIFDAAMTCEVFGCGWGSSGNRLYRNESAAQFSDYTDIAGVRDGGWGWGATFFDFDNDGDLDLGMTGGMFFPQVPYEDPFNDDPPRLWENDGTGLMTEVSAAAQFTDTRPGKGFLTFDYDRDGDLDVFIANNADHPVLYRNNGGNAGDWLMVSLRGRQTNRFGIGARIYVQVSANGPTQMREVSIRSNYMSHNDVVAHFGLGVAVPSIPQPPALPGDLDSGISVRVEWPASGMIQQLDNVAPNQHVTIEEPAPGDIDGDGDVDEADQMLFVQVLLSIDTGDPLHVVRSDLNGDDLANGGDIRLFVDARLSS